MKSFYTILKILAVLAAIVGIVFLVATYGDKIVAWFKRLLGKKRFQGDCDDCECDGDCENCDCDCYYEGDDVAADVDFEE